VICPGYKITPAVSRAVGDSFAAGMIYALDDYLGKPNLRYKCFPLRDLGDYGNALGALAAEGHEHINPAMFRWLRSRSLGNPKD
jgi:sugar/nucleoside kinase (ribokinase family)